MTDSDKLGRLLTRLTAEKPGSSAAEKLRAEASRALLQIVMAGGRRGADRAIKTMRLGALRLSKDRMVSTVSQWSVAIDAEPPRSLVLWFSPMIQAATVRYEAERTPPKLTPAQRAKLETQEAFYKRYMEVGQRWHRGLGPRRLPKSDNVILLIGELEADVNNGGFSQYLDNKGRRRAKQALAALKTIGARKTAAMLSTALSPRVTERTLSALDARFDKMPEDLAVLTMRWAARRARRA